MAINEKKNRKPVELQQINSLSIKNDLILRKSDSIYTDLVSRVKNTVKIQRSKDKPFDIFEKYRKWKHLFQKKTTAKALLKHQPWDHEILFEKNKEPTFGPIYKFSTKEFDVLRNYIDENLRKKTED